MFIHQDSGLINVSYFKFDVDDAKSEYLLLILPINLNKYWKIFYNIIVISLFSRFRKNAYDNFELF